MANFNSETKDIVSKIKDSHKYSWDKMKESYNVFAPQLNLLYTLNISKPEWDELIEELKNDEFVNQNSVIALSDDYSNGLKPNTYKYSAWALYKESLIKKGWSKKSIQNITNSSANILSKLQCDNRSKTACKGLVVGDIQSGKTANMTALIAQAADNGFNLFIILSGMIESLRKQTAQRIRADLTSNGTTNLNWKILDNPSLKRNEYQVESLDIREVSHDRFITVSLKNSRRLQDLYHWLRSNSGKQKQMKVLVIDDEADQASVNTGDITQDSARTKINQCIRNIVNDRSFGAMNYIAYTATPFANVLNEAGDDTLYPKNFIELLNPAEDYIGAEQIFGTTEPENSPSIPIVEEIPAEDSKALKNVAKKKITEIPSSLQDAINWFLLCVAAMRSYGYRKPISMMIHTSFRITDHEAMARIVSDYLKDLKEDYLGCLYDFHSLYEKIKSNLSLDDFLKEMTNYTIKRAEMHDYPSWRDVVKELTYLFELNDDDYLTNIKTDDNGALKYGTGIHLCVDNSSAKLGDDDNLTRLIYPNNPNATEKAPAFIVIGGNTLSRGLTIQGLVSTYFLRTTNQADTLMQMARWFGFRQGYELFPRIWLDDNAHKRYEFLSQMNSDMRQRMTVYSTNGVTPLEYQPSIDECPEYQMVKITSKNKMQGAVPKEFDFGGESPQTTVFENDDEKLRHNLKVTADFIRSLSEPVKKDQRYLIWKNVTMQKIINYLNNYKTTSLDRKISNLPNVIKWLDSNLESMKLWHYWNVVLAGPKTAKNTWDIGNDIKVGKIVRTRKKKKPKNDVGPDIIDIAVLRSPVDLLADINDVTKDEINDVKYSSKMREIREKHGLKDIPQLLIYCIDKDSKARRKSREDLNAKEDIIGISLLIPGVVSESKNNIKSVQIDINRFRDAEDIGENVDEEEFE